MKSTLIAAAVLTLVVLVAGCGDSKPTAAEANARLCSELARVAATLTPILAPTSETTIGELKGVKDKLESELGDLSDAAQDVEVATRSELDSAANDLEHSLASIPDDATLPEAVAAAGNALAAFGTAFKQTVAAADCGS